jgi:hypothetical protein
MKKAVLWKANARNMANDRAIAEKASYGGASRLLDLKCLMNYSRRETRVLERIP